MTFSQIFDFYLELMDAGQGSLGFLDFTFEFLISFLILRDVNLGLLAENFDVIIDDSLVKIFTTKVVVARCSDDLKNASFDLQNANIKSSTSKVEHENVLLILLIETIGHCGGCWLVQDSHDVETSYSTSISGSLSLSICEVCWNSYHSVFHLCSKIGFSLLFQLL